MAFKEIIICEKGSQARIFSKYFKLNQFHTVKGERTVYYDHKDGLAVVPMSGHLLEFMPPEFYAPGLSNDKDGWSLKHLPVIPELGKWKMQPIKNGPPKKVKRDNALLEGIKWGVLTNGIPAEITLAVDNDKEGELLGWEVLEYFGVADKTNISRLLYSTINEKSMVEAYGKKSPGSEWYLRYQAGLARAYADWLVGMNLTIALTTHNSEMLPRYYPLNSGRVIYAIIFLIRKRYDAIRDFVPREYFNEKVLFESSGGDSFIAKVIYPDQHLDLSDPNNGKMLSKEIAAKYHAFLSSGNRKGVIEAFNEKRKSEGPPLGYDRNSFDRHMIKKHGMSLEQINKALQSLYSEKGLASYPRVDVKYLDKDKHHPDMPLHIKAMMCNLKSAPQLTDKEKRLYDRAFGLVDSSAMSKMFKKDIEDKEAHHAIIPTDSQSDLSKLSHDEFVVYRELCDRLLIQFLPNYEYSSTEVIIDVEGKVKCKTTGTTPIRKGWKGLGIDPLKESADGDEDGPSTIPMMKVGEAVIVVSSETTSTTTTSPKPYTEDELLKDMSNPGRFVEKKELLKKIKKLTIGTSATQGVHVNQLEPKGFVVRKREGKGKKAPEYIIPTRKLIAVSEIAPDYIKLPEVSAYWEDTFENIFKGMKTLEEFYSQQTKLLHRFFSELHKGAFKLTAPAVEKFRECKGDCDGFLFFRELKKKSFNLWSCSKCDSAFFDEDGEPGEKLGARKERGPAPDAPRSPCPSCKGEAYHKPIPGKTWSLWVCTACDDSFFDDKGSIGKKMAKKK